MQDPLSSVSRRISTAAIVAMLSVVLAGCGGMRLHDASRAESSSTIKTNYEKADLVGTVAVQRENLDALLAAELEVVRNNQQLQLDISLLELADNDTPMFGTWNEGIERPLAALGFTSSAKAREFLDAGDDVLLRREQLRGQQRRLEKTSGEAIDDCEAGTTFTEEFKNKGRSHERYAETCLKWQEAFETVKQAGGDIAAAQKDLLEAKLALGKSAQQVADAKKAVAAVTSEHKKAVDEVKQAEGTAKAVRKSIADNAVKLQNALNAGTDIAPDVLSEERVNALVILLKAAATEQTTVEDDEDLAKAVLLVGGVSSLSADIAGLVAEAEAPSVSNLLIELQHQVVLLEHAKALKALDVRRRDVMEARLAAYLAELDELLKLRDALCSFAFHMADKEHPGVECDTFTVLPESNGCKTAATVINDCALAKPWKKYLKSPPQDAAGREFYKALAAFTRIFPLRAARMEQNYRLIDLQHRENLVNREMALKAWNNLAAVPVDQIAAYYDAGLKPGEIADFIVKALGFTAVTIAVLSK